MTTALGLAAILALILANGYFVAAEFAFVAVRKGKLEELAEAGDARASRALLVLRRLSFMLSGAQLGITVTSLIVGFIAEPVLGRALRPLFELAGLSGAAATGVALTTGFILATSVQMIMGELAPKNLAIAEPERFSMSLARSTYLYTRIAGPIIKLFDNSSNALLRALGIEPVEELPAGVSADELGYIISESRRGGTLGHQTATLLNRALDFRSLRAVEVMVPRTQVHHLHSDDSGAALRDLALRTGHSRFPVVGESLDDLVGLVQAKDLFRVPPDERPTTIVRELMTPVLAIPESTPLSLLLGDMRASRSQIAVVVDEYGGTAGIVTLEDIVEELVGSIEDEYDPDEPAVRALDDGSFLVPGSWRLDETQRDTGIALPDGDYETVGGLVMERLGRMPGLGDTVAVPGGSLRVEAMDGLAVSQVLLRRAPVVEDQ
jgi:CBS domain containing-hemolysin-like protein